MLNIEIKKLCECGCGGIVGSYSETNKKRGYKKGEPIRFLKGHYAKTVIPRGRYIDKDGYVNIYDSKHPSATVRKTVPEHRLIAEKAVGRHLKRGELVHHIDGNKSNNKNNNLIVCQDDAYHKLLHYREAAYLASGNADFKKCHICHKYDDVKNMTWLEKYKWAYHKSCNAKYHRERRQRVLQTMDEHPEMDDRRKLEHLST